jgi:hypothetical protein
MGPQPGATDGQPGNALADTDAEAQLASQIMLVEYIAMWTEEYRR